jgi:hypothetical protein
MEYVRIPEIISAFSGRDSSRVRHLAIFYQNDQLLSVTHPTSVDNPIALAPPLPYPVAEEGRSHLFNNLDPTLSDEKPTYTHISINIKHNFNQTNRTTLPIFRVIQQARSASLIVITGSDVEVISSGITSEERVLTLHTPIGGQ